MPDPNQAQIEEKSASNKNVQPVKTYGQATMYATLPQGPNISDSGRANPPPEPTILPPSHPLSIPYSESELSQYNTIHPTTNQMPNLSDVNATKGNEAVYNYVKSQPIQQEPVKLSPSEPKDTSGLVEIYAGRETKNGVTTETTTTPSYSFGPQTMGQKLAEAQGRIQVVNMGGEAVSFLKVPFIGKKAENPNQSFVAETSLADVAGILPVGGGQLAKGAELAAKGLTKLAGKDVVTVASKIEPAFQESTLEVRKETASKGVIQLTQGTEQEVRLTELRPEIGPPQLERGTIVGKEFIPTSKTVTSKIDIGGGKTVEVAEKVPIGTAVKSNIPILPKGITETKTVEGLGKVGEKTVPHEPTPEEVANRYPLFGQGKNDLTDLTKGEVPKPIPETEQKPIFSKITKEVPNIIDITKQATKSGQAELPEAFVSQKQVAFTRPPSTLEENKIIITGKPSPEIISTFGLKLIRGTKNVFISSGLTKGMKEYLTGAEKAGLITPRLSETHIQSAKDVLKNPKLYAQASREPKIFETYPELVKPQVIGTREAYPMKTQILKKSSDELKSFRKMQPFGPIKESKGSAGSQARAKAILESKPEPKPLNKPELFKTEKEAKTGFESPFGISTATATYETLAYPKGTEQKFLQSFKSANEIVTTSLRTNKTETILTEKVSSGQKARSMTGLAMLQKNVQDTLTVSQQKEESLSDLLTRTELTSKQESGLISGQQTDQITGLTTKQTTTQTTTTRTPPPDLTTNPPNNPPPILFEEKKKLPKKKLKKFKAKEINFLGASTESTVIGLTRREELTYGNKKTAQLLSKGRKLERAGNYLSYLKNINKYKPTKVSAKPFSSKKPKNEFTSKQNKKLRF